jgi:hypothetical protein
MISMQYLLLLYDREAQWENMPEAEMAKVMQAYLSYTEALRNSGVYVGSNRLQPIATATTVRTTSGKNQIDLDAAISWAARCPCSSHGTVEVRPIWAMAAGA